MNHVVFVEHGQMLQLRDYQQTAYEIFIKGGKEEYHYQNWGQRISFIIKKTDDFPDAPVYQFIRSDGSMAYIAESKKDMENYLLWVRMNDYG